MLRYKTETAWISHTVRHLARKRSGSILTTTEPARAIFPAITSGKAEYSSPKKP